MTGEAVTAEGLFRAALDGLQGIAEEVDDGLVRSQRSAEAVPPPILFSSPIHPYSKAAMLQGYSELLLQWEKREAEGEIAARQAEKASIPQLWRPGAVYVCLVEELSVAPRVGLACRCQIGACLARWPSWMNGSYSRPDQQTKEK